MGHKLQPEVVRHYLQILIYDLYDSSVSAVQANESPQRDRVQILFERFRYV